MPGEGWCDVPTQVVVGMTALGVERTSADGPSPDVVAALLFERRAIRAASNLDANGLASPRDRWPRVRHLSTTLVTTAGITASPAAASRLEP